MFLALYDNTFINHCFLICSCGVNPMAKEIKNSKKLFVVKSRFKKNGEIGTNCAVFADLEDAKTEASRDATPMADNKRGTDFYVAEVFSTEKVAHFTDSGSFSSPSDKIMEFDSRDRDADQILSVDDVVASLGDEGVGFVREVTDQIVVVQHKDSKEEYHPEELEVCAYDEDIGDGDN